MEVQVGSTASIRDSIPWLLTFLNYTDEVCAAVSETNRDWRASDRQGNWYFSLLEQVMHIADSRHDISANIEDGLEESSAHQSWCTKSGGTAEPWSFRSGPVDEVLASLAAGRAKIESWLDLPAGDLLTVTDGSRQLFEQRIVALKQKGRETAALEKRGPTPVINSLLFLAAHEQGHRCVLQHHLRVSGSLVVRYA